jgi:hypothetical protein
MSKTRNTLAILACLVALAGCATTSSGGQVKEVGEGIYTVGIRPTLGGMSQSSAAISDAVDKAGEYCHSKGQKISVVPGPGSEVRFRCVASDEVAPAAH